MCLFVFGLGWGSALCGAGQVHCPVKSLLSVRAKKAPGIIHRWDVQGGGWLHGADATRPTSVLVMLSAGNAAAAAAAGVPVEAGLVPFYPTWQDLYFSGKEGGQRSGAERRLSKTRVLGLHSSGMGGSWYKYWCLCPISVGRYLLSMLCWGVLSATRKQPA